MQTQIQMNNTDKPYLEINNKGQVIYLELTAQRHILGRDREKSDLIVPKDWKVIGRIQAVLEKEGENYRIYDGNAQQPSTNKLFIGRTRITPTQGYSLTNGIQILVGQNPQNLIQLRYFNPSSKEPVISKLKHSISLENKSVLIGRDKDADLILNAPTISDRHATIYAGSQGNYILLDHSSNGVFVNGERVNRKTVLSNGAIIRIGPFTLLLQGDRLEILDRENQIRLDASGLILESNGIKRLDDLSFAIEPGQFVAIVGGSGTGKSTLIRSLLGIEAINKGVVSLNGENLRENFNIFRTHIGYVPQDDIIHRELTVAEVLTYAAKLRLPPDINVEQVVRRALEDIKMTEHRNAIVNQLSGGQRKRVSIGVELLSDPKLFFLDEPTSGLDPGLDLQMMQLLKELAHKETQTIILVTHATTNIMECDRVIFLGLGGHLGREGRLCFFGLPQEALDFFAVENFADIYVKLQKKQEVDEWVNKFKKSDYYKRYIEDSLSPSPQKSELYSQPKSKQVNLFRQIYFLTKRYLQLVLRDYGNLVLSLLTAPIGISLMTLVMKGKDPLVLGNVDPSSAPLALRVLFIFTCAALWVGLFSSLQEIVKESAIYFRERLVNLNLFTYIGSKVIVLSSLAMLQTLLMTIFILIFFKSPQPEREINISWHLGLFITTFFTLLSSFSLGLICIICCQE